MMQHKNFFSLSHLPFRFVPVHMCRSCPVACSSGFVTAPRVSCSTRPRRRLAAVRRSPMVHLSHVSQHTRRQGAHLGCRSFSVVRELRHALRAPAASLARHSTLCATAHAPRSHAVGAHRTAPRFRITSPPLRSMLIASPHCVRKPASCARLCPRVRRGSSRAARTGRLCSGLSIA